MTTQVFDQFLRRRHNQFYFGFFVGLALYALLTLATVTEPFNPVYGAALAISLTAVALYLLILLLYTTINQMRPAEIVEAIHDHVLTARGRLLPLVRRTRRTSLAGGRTARVVRSERHGFVTRIDFDAVARAAAAVHAHAEVVLRVSIGTFVAYGDIVAELRAPAGAKDGNVDATIQHAIRLERQRDIEFDPAYAIEQLEMIAWTSISTSKSNPLPGLLSVRALRDVLARWAAEHEKDTEPDGEPMPIVYDDRAVDRLFGTLESLGVVASESMQHQSLAEVLLALASTYRRLPVEWRPRADDVILRLLSSLGEHVLTAELDLSLTELVDGLREVGRGETASAVARAQEELRGSVGKLGSRATRVEA